MKISNNKYHGSGRLYTKFELADRAAYNYNKRFYDGYKTRISTDVKGVVTFLRGLIKPFVRATYKRTKNGRRSHCYRGRENDWKYEGTL